jgi:hypothetical protein
VLLWWMTWPFSTRKLIFEKTHKFSFCIKKTPQSITNNINKHTQRYIIHT